MLSQKIPGINGLYSNVMEEGNYNSFANFLPIPEHALPYLKKEIEKVASVNIHKDVKIGIGFAGFHDGLSVAKNASKRRELSDDLSAREVEIKLRKYAEKFPNVRLISINTTPAHICKMPIWVFGDYSQN